MTIYNYNQQPYFDDFDYHKNFASVLFKPKFPVQARELNQLQSIIHHQLDRFSSHIFKHGSPVKGNPPKHIVSNYVTLEAISPYDNLDVNLVKMHGVFLRGASSKIEATLIHTVDKTSTEPPTIYVKYTKTAIDTTTSVFLNGEILEVVDANNNVSYKAKVRCPSCPGQSQAYPGIAPTGYGVLWFIQDSSYFIDGLFIDVNNSILVAEKYTRDVASYKVGFDVITDIVSYNEDNSLLDNALGYPNFQAPGADRERVRLVPVVRSLNYEDGEKFILLASVEQGKIKYLNDTPRYADILDTMARRTYDESGNYTVSPFTVSFKEHLAKTASDPDGVYIAEKGGNPSKMVAIVSPGTGYVRGYEVKKVSETNVIIDKARDTKKIANFLNRTGSLNYILIDNDAIVNATIQNDPTANISSVFSNINIDLYDGIPSNGLPVGNQIGTLKGVDMVADFQFGYFIAWRVYFVDMILSPGKQYQDVKSLSGTFVSGKQLLVPYPDPATGKPRVYDANKSSWIYDLGKKNVKSLRDINNPTQSSMGYSQRKRFHGTLDVNGSFTWTSATNEKFDSPKLGSTYAHIISGSVYTQVAFSQITLTSDGITDTLSVDTGNSSNAGKLVQLVHTVMNNNVFEKVKSIVRITETNKQLNGSSFALTKSDLYKIIKITANDAQLSDVTKFFTWTNGQLDWAYVPIVLTKANNAPVWESTIRFSVEYEYYDHGTTGHFFSVDSYTSLINTPSKNYTYSDIPRYTSSDGQTYLLRDCVDFRPLILNPSVFDFTQPALDSIFTVDIEYYLPRIDLLIINKNSEIYAKPGISSDNPVAPLVDESSEMAVYAIRMASYIHDIEKDVTTSFIENKRYTMRDIGKLDDRVSLLEKYTNFTVAEQRIVDTPIKDKNGAELYKNGFVVDSFGDFMFSALSDTEYRCSIDRSKLLLQPAYSMFSNDFTFSASESQNYRQYGDVLMLNHKEETYVNQPFASEAIHINDHLVPDYVGKVIMIPNVDNWADLANNPKAIIDATSGINPNTLIVDKIGVASAEAEVWGWLNNAAHQSHYAGPSTPVLVQKDLNTAASFNELNAVNPYQNPNILKSIIKIWPLIRRRRVKFFATGLKPNTRVYCFFDGVNISEFTRPIHTQANYGDPVVVDGFGNVSGEIKIPSKRFRCGPKQFRIANTPDASTDPFLTDTWAETVWWAAGAWAMGWARENVFTSIWRTEEQRKKDNVVADKNWNKPDPIAQTFTVTQDSFITSVDLFFQSIHPDDRIDLEIRNVIEGAGIPGVEVLGSCNKRPANISVSNDSTIPTKFDLIYPVFLRAGNKYAVVISSSNPATKVWSSTLGANDIIHYGQKISKQLDTGSLYKSQNDKWEEVKSSDLKIEIRRANFLVNNMTLVFRNTELMDDNSETESIETGFGSTQVRIHRLNHGVAVGDVYKFDLSSGMWLNFTMNDPSFVFSIGQKIITGTGSGVIADIRAGASSTVECQMTSIEGYFAIGQAFTVNNFTPTLPDTYLINNFIQSATILPSTLNVTGVCNTSSVVDINGIPSTEFNREVAVTAVDSTNSFIIQTSIPATSSGRITRESYLNANHKYDKFVVSSSYTALNCSEKWELSGIGHKSYELFDNNNYIRQPNVPFKIGETVSLNVPFKLANSTNETRIFGKTGESIKVVATFEGYNNYSSPIVNVKTLSIIGISNKIDEDVISTFNVAPNAANRLIPETHNKEGNASYKYVTQVLNLKNSAKELKIFLDVIKPRYSNFEIYIKTLNVGDNRSIEDVAWVRLPIDHLKDFTSTNRTDFRHIEFIVGEVLPTAFSSLTASFTAVKVKIVGTSKNSAQPPLYKNLKVVALT